MYALIRFDGSRCTGHAVVVVGGPAASIGNPMPDGSDVDVAVLAISENREDLDSMKAEIESRPITPAPTPCGRGAQHFNGCCECYGYNP